MRCGSLEFSGNVDVHLELLWLIWDFVDLTGQIVMCVVMCCVVLCCASVANEALMAEPEPKTQKTIIAAVQQT